MKVLGDFLKEMRMKRGYKSHEVATNIDVGASTYSHYENDRIQLVLPVFYKLAEFYNMHPADFLRKAIQGTDYDFPYLVAEPEPEYSVKEVTELRAELERKIKEIGALEYRLSKYEPVNEIKGKGA